MKEVGRGREEEKSEEKQSVERRSSTKKIKVHEKVEKSRNNVLFQCFVAPERRKVGSLKLRVRSHLRWQM